LIAGKEKEVFLVSEIVLAHHFMAFWLRTSGDGVGPWSPRSRLGLRNLSSAQTPVPPKRQKKKERKKKINISCAQTPGPPPKKKKKVLAVMAKQGGPCL
jgi:hypothetical protein